MSKDEFFENDPSLEQTKIMTRRVLLAILFFTLTGIGICQLSNFLK